MLVASPPPSSTLLLLLLSYMQLSLHLARLRCSKVASVDVVFSTPPPRSTPPPEPNVQPSANACVFLSPSSQKSAQALTSFGQRHFPFALMRRGGREAQRLLPSSFSYSRPPCIEPYSRSRSQQASAKGKKKEGGNLKLKNRPPCSARASNGGRARSAIDGRANAQL